MCIHVYIYIYIYIHTYVYIHNIYIYIYTLISNNIKGGGPHLVPAGADLLAPGRPS